MAWLLSPLSRTGYGHGHGHGNGNGNGNGHGNGMQMELGAGTRPAVASCACLSQRPTVLAGKRRLFHIKRSSSASHLLFSLHSHQHLRFAPSHPIPSSPRLDSTRLDSTRLDWTRPVYIFNHPSHHLLSLLLRPKRRSLPHSPCFPRRRSLSSALSPVPGLATPRVLGTATMLTLSPTSPRR